MNLEAATSELLAKYTPAQLCILLEMHCHNEFSRLVNENPEKSIDGMQRAIAASAAAGYVKKAKEALQEATR